MTEYIREEDKAFREKFFSLADEETIAWVSEKSSAFIRLMSYYRCAMMEIETKLNVLNEEFSLQQDRNPISSIKSRLKSLPSLRDKLERKGLPISLSAIEAGVWDMAGIRVICSFPEDVYAIADALLKQDDITLVRRKDYIAQPKENGYRSLHLIVSVPIFLENEKRAMKVELQLRTIAMDCWASLEHQLRYKKQRDFSPAMLEDLKACAELSAELDARMSRLHQEILADPETDAAEKG